MFFTASKLGWFLITPSNVLIAGILIGVLLTFSRFVKVGRGLALVSLLCLCACAFLPVGVWLRAPLENRFPVQSQEMRPPTGIIILGGAIDEATTSARGGQVAVRVAATRITEAVALARRYPQAKVIYTGGSPALFAAGGADEAAVAAKLLTSLGLDPSRITLERESRNTWENAVLLKPMIAQNPGETWLLVTSAWHMPRSVGIFRKVGISVVPYPVDFETRNTTWERMRPIGIASQGLDLVDKSAREWVGLFAYWLAGKTDALFPAP